MASHSDNPLFTRLRAKGHPVVDDAPKLDLETYISNYRGRTRFSRLLTIGTSSTYLSLEALKAAISEAKAGNDASRYETAVKTLAEAAPGDPDAVLDSAWVEKTKRVGKAETDKMELELKGYKNNLIKESIRMGYQDLGKQYQSIGDLPNSLKAFNKMYDFMTTNSHLVAMSMYLIQLSVDQKNWYSVSMNAQRIWAGGSPKYEEAKKQSAKLTSALGLSELAARNYSLAADYFIRTDPRMVQAKLSDPEDEESFNEVLTPNDVASYGALCALASFDRSQLQSRVLEHKTFRSYLELEPHLRRAISFFIASKYSACLSILEAWKGDYLLDIYLQPCFLDILERVRRKAMQQYIVPFSCVTLESLAKAFNTNETSLEVELTQMIKRGDLQAKIDLVDRLLVTKKANQKAQVQEKTLKTAKEYERTAHLRMLRMGILNAGLEVKPSKEKSQVTNQSHGLPGEDYESEMPDYLGPTLRAR